MMEKSCKEKTPGSIRKPLPNWIRIGSLMRKVFSRRMRNHNLKRKKNLNSIRKSNAINKVKPFQLWKQY